MQEIPMPGSGTGDAGQITVHGHAGAAIELPITLGPATGYVWKLEMPAGVEAIDSGQARPIDPSERAGGAQGGRLRIRAVAGEHEVTARLQRPFGDSPPIRQVHIRVIVD